MMNRRFAITALILAGLVMTLSARAETTRNKLLEFVETMGGHTTASKQALRPVIEKASDAKIGAFDRGLYFEDIGDPKAARKYYERAATLLDPNTPGKDAWCVAYQLLRIPDDKVDQTHPAVKDMLDLRQQLNIPVMAGDLEKTATTARIRDLWNALPEAAQAESGPLPKELSLIERAVALAGRGYAQDERVRQPSQASALCWVRGPNLKPFYVEAAKLGLADFQLDVANDLAKTNSFPGFWEEAVKWYRQVAKNAQPPLSVIAATGAARVSERLLSADTPHPRPMAWPEILAAYRAGMEAGHEAALVLYADALQRGLGGLKADEAEAVRLYKSLLDQKDGLYGGLTTIVFWVYAQEKLTALWRAEKLEFTEAEERRYLTLGTEPRTTKQP
jgi:TPR repeat protein